jgi:hypothetical protein
MTTIKIGSRQFTIKRASVVVSSNGQECHGLTDHLNDLIVLSKQYPTHHKDTIIHELLHAMLDASGASRLVSDEELFVRILTPHLLSVIQQLIAKKLLQ